MTIYVSVSLAAQAVTHLVLFPHALQLLVTLAYQSVQRIVHILYAELQINH